MKNLWASTLYMYTSRKKKLCILKNHLKFSNVKFSVKLMNDPNYLAGVFSFFTAGAHETFVQFKVGS